MKMSPSKRLALALNVLNVDLDNARPGDLLNAKDDARKFLEPPPWEEGAVIIYRDASSFAPTWEISDEELHRLQRDGRALFGKYIEHQDTLRRHEGIQLPKKFTEEPFFMFQPITTKWLLLPFGAPKAKRALAILSATSARDAFLTLLGFLAVTSGAGDIRSCPVCKKLFVRTHRQDYCSSRCQGVSTSRAYRARKKREQEKRKRLALKRKMKPKPKAKAKKPQKRRSSK